jgi:hypothetical protein
MFNGNLMYPAFFHENSPVTYPDKKAWQYYIAGEKVSAICAFNHQQSGATLDKFETVRFRMYHTSTARQGGALKYMCIFRKNMDFYKT